MSARGQSPVARGAPARPQPPLRQSSHFEEFVSSRHWRRIRLRLSLIGFSESIEFIPSPFGRGQVSSRANLCLPRWPQSGRIFIAMWANPFFRSGGAEYLGSLNYYAPPELRAFFGHGVYKYFVPPGLKAVDFASSPQLYPLGRGGIVFSKVSRV